MMHMSATQLRKSKLTSFGPVPCPQNQNLCPQQLRITKAKGIKPKLSEVLMPSTIGDLKSARQCLCEIVESIKVDIW